MQLDPLEKEWLKSSALGDVATQRRLLRQDGSLLMKKVLVLAAIAAALYNILKLL